MSFRSGGIAESTGGEVGPKDKRAQDVWALKASKCSILRC